MLVLLQNDMTVVNLHNILQGCW